jgi:hypothetical protein
VNKKNAKKYWEMTAAELAEATKEFDEPFVGSKGRRMNSAERKQEQRFRMKLGRPRQGKGAKAVSVTIEQGLLSRTDAHAKRLGLSRAQFIARSLEQALRRKTA